MKSFDNNHIFFLHNVKNIHDFKIHGFQYINNFFGIFILHWTLDANKKVRGLISIFSSFFNVYLVFYTNSHFNNISSAFTLLYL